MHGSKVPAGWILLVEDSSDDEVLALRAFRHLGILEPIVVAHDGEEALRQLSNSEPPIAILLDIKLPKISGGDVLQRIRHDARLSHVPVVMLTASDNPQDRRQCLELGITDFVRKGHDYHEYISTLRACMVKYVRPDVNLL